VLHPVDADRRKEASAKSVEFEVSAQVIGIHGDVRLQRAEVNFSSPLPTPADCRLKTGSSTMNRAPHEQAY
jgi:hypothetical protein